ncbi:ankyrin repeat domain containing protein, putative [Babesia bigemina]|uniref:Ankyrin repeat domain containing protein, putative n=1 Tax=Babesia bigemina TaxID=5866 RepID=A0A061D4V4_BABBI|nr:ankyrin repeat domain containing protein, putative [Babesia bigemina]CDR95598.1 ankyrin repeat domain containing protein, putative [Babesia bigemina]|eukprot:XP_012767784.1 ankyrin repeat domain containing protein, putative [Babesia bigemina]
MVDVPSNARRVSSQKRGRGGGAPRRPADRRSKEPAAAPSGKAAPVQPPAPAVERSDSAPAPTSLPAAGTGITTECFNNLLSNFTQALTASTPQAAVGDGQQTQLLCEMGKLFLSSMMTFNQIMQNHAASSLVTPQAAAPASTEPAVIPGGEVPESSAASSTAGAFKKQEPRVAGKGATRPQRTNAKPSVKPARRDSESSGTAKATKTGVDGSEAEVSGDATHPSVDATSGNAASVDGQKPHRKEQSSRQGDSRRRGDATHPCDKAQHPVPHNKRADALSGGDSKRPYGAQKGNRPSGKRDDTSTRYGSHAAGKNVGRRVGRADGNKHMSVATAVQSPSAVVAATDQETPKVDFNTAPTPINVIEGAEGAYLDGLVSAEEQLNFSIYRFVDSCTNANAAATERKVTVGVENPAGWVGEQPARECTTLTQTTDGTCSDAFPSGAVPNSIAEFMRAAFMGDLEQLKMQKDVDVSHVDDVGRSALHYASAAGSSACVEYLLASGVDVNLADRKGWTAIHIAVSKNFTDVAKILVDAGANIFTLLKHKCAPVRLMDVYSPAIHFAAIKGNKEITQLLLDHGATLNDLDSANMTPLHYAAFRANTDYLRFVLDNGAVVNVRDVNGRSPFHAAALSGLVENVKLMVERQPFLNEEDIWSLTPYKLAELRKHADFVTYLRETLHVSEEDPDDINRVLASTIAVALQEPNADQIYRCVTRIGADLSKTVFDLTMQIERNGGVLTADGSRKRTSGGIFFTCLRELYLNDIISKDDYNYIRAAENEKRIANAKDRRNLLKART